MSVRLFVGNLSYGVTEAELRELFSAAGSISQVRIPTDRETGKQRGFAFVDFDDPSHAQEAVRRFNQYQFRDRVIAVNEARAREAGSVGARPPARPGSASTFRPGELDRLATNQSEDSRTTVGQPRRNFGPDATARGKRRQDKHGSREERGSKGPLRECSGGQIFPGAGLGDDDQDPGADDFALWAREDARRQDEE